MTKETTDTIRLVKQEDGNWKGYWHNHGKDIEVRTVDPYSALLALLTHD